MIYVYIDESGNLGKSGEYFVLSAVVFDTEKGRNRVKRVIRKEQLIVAGSKEKKNEIKFSRLGFVSRQRILNKIVRRADGDLYYFVAYKPEVMLLNEGKSKNLVYNYFAWLLCEQFFKKYNDDFMIIFDQRSTTVKSMNSLTDYIKSNAFTLANLVRKQIVVNQADSKTNFLLQAADMVAGATYQSYNNKLDHFFNILKTRVIDFDEFPRGGFPEEN